MHTTSILHCLVLSLLFDPYPWLSELFWASCSQFLTGQEDRFGGRSHWRTPDDRGSSGGVRGLLQCPTNWGLESERVASRDPCQKPTCLPTKRSLIGGSVFCGMSCPLGPLGLVSKWGGPQLLQFGGLPFFGDKSHLSRRFVALKAAFKIFQVR